MNVYNCLEAKKTNNIWGKYLNELPSESIILAALLHDLCKTYFYVIEFRNKKNEKGVWEKVPYYTVDDKIPYGHGEKSVMMIEEYIKLTPMERYAIRWHMGWSEAKEKIINRYSPDMTNVPRWFCQCYEVKDGKDYSGT